MWIEFKSIYAGPNGVHKAGAVVDMESKEANALIDGGYAIETVSPAKAAKQKEADEKEVSDEDKKTAEAKAKAKAKAKRK